MSELGCCRMNRSTLSFKKHRKHIPANQQLYISEAKSVQKNLFLLICQTRGWSLLSEQIVLLMWLICVAFVSSTMRLFSQWCGTVEILIYYYH